MEVLNGDVSSLIGIKMRKKNDTLFVGLYL